MPMPMSRTAPRPLCSWLICALLAAAAAVLIAQAGCSKGGDADLARNPRIRDWQGFFFARKAPVQDDGVLEYECTPVPVSLPAGAAPDGMLVCSGEGGACLIVDPGYLLEEGRVVRGEPDSFVSLYDPAAGSMCRFMTMGPAGCIHGGTWLKESMFAVFGMAGEDGFLWKVDLDARRVWKYKIPGSYRRPELSEQDYFTRLWKAPGPAGTEV